MVILAFNHEHRHHPYHPPERPDNNEDIAANGKPNDAKNNSQCFKTHQSPDDLDLVIMIRRSMKMVDDDDDDDDGG